MSFTTYLIPEPAKKETAQSKKWLWIVTDHQVLPPHEELLHKICQALKANFSDDVYLIHCTPSEPIILSDLNTGNTSLILSFGLLPSTLGFWIDLQSPGIRFLESFCFVLSARLDELMNQSNAKKQLWTCMQSYLQWTENEKKKNTAG